MSKIAFLGLGVMGSRMAVRLTEADHDVTDWNRSSAAVIAAVARGARSAETPLKAAEGAEFVFSMVTDDEASKAVWLTANTGARAGLGRGAAAIEASTVSPDWLMGLAAAVEAHGASLLDAPVVGSLPQAETAHTIDATQVCATERPATPAVAHEARRRPMFVMVRCTFLREM